MKRVYTLALVCLLLLSSCAIHSFDTVLSLTTAGEAWTLQFDLLVSTADLERDPAVTQETIDEMTTDLNDISQQLGIEYTMEKGDIDAQGNQPFLLTFSGQRYQQLNEFLETADIVRVDENSGKRTITFRWNEYYLISGESDDFSVDQLTFTLDSDGQVIESNGSLLDDASVFWHNPTGSIYAVIQEAYHPPIRSADGELTCLSDENWQYSLTLSIAGDEVTVSRLEIEHFLQRLVESERANPAAQGVAIDWMELQPLSSGSVPFRLMYSGTTYAQLNGLFAEEVLRLDGSSGKTETLFSISSFTPEQLGTDNLTFLLLPGDRHVSQSNGIEQKDGSILWVNAAEPLTATMKESMLALDLSSINSSRRTLLLVLLCSSSVLAVLLAATAVYLIQKGRNAA